MITYTWIIEWMQCRVQEGDLQNVVITAGWRCNAVDDNYTATAYGSCAFPAPEGSFTPYADLTQTQVLDWCWTNGVDQAATEANLAHQIENQINPPVVQPPLPWAD